MVREGGPRKGRPVSGRARNAKALGQKCTWLCPQGAAWLEQSVAKGGLTEGHSAGGASTENWGTVGQITQHIDFILIGRRNVMVSSRKC